MSATTILWTPKLWVNKPFRDITDAIHTASMEIDCFEERLVALNYEEELWDAIYDALELEVTAQAPKA